MKKIIALIIVVCVFSLTLSACDDNTPAPSPKNTVDATTLSPDISATPPAQGTDFPDMTYYDIWGLSEYWRISDDHKTLTISIIGEMPDFTEEHMPPWTEYTTEIENIVIDKNLTRIGDYAFIRISNMTSITVPDSVRTIGVGAFGWCYALNDVTLPPKLREIEEKAFACCDALTNITIPSQVEQLAENVFYNCTNLQNINIAEDNATYKSTNGIVFTKDGAGLVCYPLGKTATSYTVPDGVINICASAFASCQTLTKITLPNGLQSIMSGAFFECRNLAEINLPDSLKVIDGWGFYRCTSLTEVALPKGLESIGDSAYKSCSSLKKAILSASTIVGDNAFDDACEVSRYPDDVQP